MLLTVKSEHKEPNMSPHIYRMLVAEKLAELRRRSGVTTTPDPRFLDPPRCARRIQLRLQRR